MSLYGLAIIIPAPGQFPTIRLFEKPFEVLLEAKRMRRALLKVLPEAADVKVVEFRLPWEDTQGMSEVPITLIRKIALEEPLA